MLRNRFSTFLVASVFSFGIAPSILHAGITATGSVSPNPPGGGDFVEVGLDFGGPSPVPGSLTVDNGSVLPLSELRIGAGASGEVTVAGDGSALTTDGSLVVGQFNGGPSLQTARLSVLDGGRIGVEFGLELGNPGQLAFVTVSGAGSELTVNDSFQGFGTTTISEGGFVSVGGDFSNGGRTTVDGAGSTLAGFSVEVDDVLRVSNGASLLGSQLNVSPSGRVEVSDAFLTFSGFNSLNNGGLITGSGRISFQGGGGPITNNGRIEARSGDELVLTAQGSNPLIFQSFGEITADGGIIEIQGLIQNEFETPTQVGVVTLRDGQLRVAGNSFSNSGFDFQNLGRIAATGGVNDLLGSVENVSNGQIAVTNNSTLIFHDEVLNDGGLISILPGSTAVFLGGVDSQFGTFQANIAGTDDDTGFGTAEVVGEAVLGTINVAALAGFEPEAGDSITLLTASSIAGNPTLGDVPELAPGLTFELNATSNALQLLVVEELPGDANFDGFVNAADFTVLRDTESDLQAFRTNFGGATSSVSAAVVVPEPTSVLLALLGLTAVASRRR